MKKKSTSIHQINADFRMNRVERVLYRVLNRLNNSYSFLWVDNKVIYHDFECKDLNQQWEKIPIESTPARRLCDLFCINLPWKEIQEELGEIHVLDCGCGSGRYAERLKAYSTIPITTYTGIDVEKSGKWQELEKKYLNFKFQQVKGNDISAYIPGKTNFILSISALEHFEEDIFYFEQIRNFIDSHKKNVLQVHCFPSRACLRLYRYHGIRQYTPRTIGKFTRLFHPFSYMTLFNLGGKSCNRVHYQCIARPMFSKKGVDLRKSDVKEYAKRLFDAIQQDMTTPSADPTFYALVIHSYFKDRLF